MRCDVHRGLGVQRSAKTKDDLRPLAGEHPRGRKELFLFALWPPWAIVFSHAPISKSFSFSDKTIHSDRPKDEHAADTDLGNFATADL